MLIPPRTNISSFFSLQGISTSSLNMPTSWSWYTAFHRELSLPSHTTRFSGGLGAVRKTVGLKDPKGLFQPK